MRSREPVSTRVQAAALVARAGRRRARGVAVLGWAQLSERAALARRCGRVHADRAALPQRVGRARIRGRAIGWNAAVRLLHLAAGAPEWRSAVVAINLGRHDLRADPGG